MSTPGNPVVPNLQDGNFAKAVAQAQANQATALQFIAVSVTNFARAQTCSGPDLDSFYAQFNFPRLQAGFAKTVATFSAIAPLTQPASIPVGTLIQTPGGGIQYSVIADPTQPTFNSATNVYTIAIGQSSTNATVEATIPGGSLNVQANQLTSLAVTIFGVTSVTNGLASTGGTNQETDVAYRARFIEYINGLSKATESAINEAVTTIQSGLKVKLLEQVVSFGGNVTNMTITGTPDIAGLTFFITNDIQIPGGGSEDTSYSNQAGDNDTTTYATHLAAAINADTVINTFVTAVATGNVIALTSTSPNATSYSCSATSGSPVFTIVTPIIGLITGAENPTVANGHILALYDDGSGNPSPALGAQVLASVENTVAYGIIYAASPPAIIVPTFTMNVRLIVGAIESAVLPAIAAQVMAYVNGLAIGGDVDGLPPGTINGFIYLSQIAEQAFLGAPGQVVATETGSITINSVAEDLSMQAFQEALIALSNINIGTF